MAWEVSIQIYSDNFSRNGLFPQQSKNSIRNISRRLIHYLIKPYKRNILTKEKRNMWNGLFGICIVKNTFFRNQLNRQLNQLTVLWSVCILHNTCNDYSKIYLRSGCKKKIYFHSNVCTCSVDINNLYLVTY